MRVTTAFKRLLRLEGVNVTGVVFGVNVVTVTVVLKRRRRDITRTCGSAICSRARRTFLVETNTSSTGDATPGGRNADVESSSK